MNQTKSRWTVGFLITAIFAFVTALSLGFGFVPSNETMTAHAETYHDQYIDRSTIKDGDVFVADTTNIHIFNDKATTDDNKEFVIVFDSNAVKAIGDANVTLSAKVVTENVEVENAELVLEVTLEGATFEGGEAKVSIPFEKEVPTGKVAKVYYIADDGTRTDMNATLLDGKIVFTTNHFSTYAVMFEDVPATGLSGWAIAGIVIGSVVLLLIIACAVLVILNKKGIIHLAFLDKKTKA